MEPVEIDLGKELGTRVFASIEDFEEWTNAEKTYWAWLDNNPRNLSSQDLHQYQTIRHYVKQHLDQVAGPIVSELRQHSTDKNRTQDIAQRTANLLREHYVARRIPHHTSARAKFLDHLRNRESSVVAAYALAYFIDYYRAPGEQIFVSPMVLRGCLNGHDFDNAASTATTAEHDALAVLRGDISTLLSKTKKRAAEVNNQLNKQSDAITTQLEKQSTDFEELKTNARIELDTIKAWYERGLQTQEPVSYWTKSARWHGAFTAAWLGGATLFLVLLWKIAPSFAAEYLKPLDPTKPYSVELWRVVVIFLFGGLAVWALRLIVRFALSHKHLASDARERATMTQVYLALVKEGKGLSEDDRKMIFSLLFHRAATGIVKDDGAPTSGFELLSRLLGGKQ